MTQIALTIRELRVRAVKVPMVHPHRTASGTPTLRQADMQCARCTALPLLDPLEATA